MRPALKVRLPNSVTMALGHVELSRIDLNHGPVARLFQQLADIPAPRPRGSMIIVPGPNYGTILVG